MTSSVAAVEEVAWIGFLLVMYARRYQLLQASIFTGLMWGVWYIPLVLAEIQVAPGLPVGPLILNFMTMAAICAWLYRRTQSAAVVFVMQLTTNYTSQIIPGTAVTRRHGSVCRVRGDEGRLRPRALCLLGA